MWFLANFWKWSSHCTTHTHFLFLLIRDALVFISKWSTNIKPADPYVWAVQAPQLHGQTTSCVFCKGITWPWENKQHHIWQHLTYKHNPHLGTSIHGGLVVPTLWPRVCNSFICKCDKMKQLSVTDFVTLKFMWQFSDWMGVWNPLICMQMWQIVMCQLKYFRKWL